MDIVRAADMRISDSDLSRVAMAFGVGDLESIGGFENALFRSADSRIVRITHTTRRSVGQVEAEFAFMDHLASADVNVVAPIHTTDGDLVYELETDDGQEVVAVCMTLAPGAIRRAPQWSDANLVTFGELLGSMHVAAESFIPPEGARRPDWTDPIFDVGIGPLEHSHPDLHRRYYEIIDRAAACPAGATNLLIHQDAHYGNMFLTDDGELTVFDFDDSAYGTAVHDVAIPLFYWVLGSDAEPPAVAERYFEHVLEGYRRHAELPAGWASDADRFLSYREIDIYWLVASEPDEDSSPGELRFMDGRYERIIDGVPYLGVPLADVVG